MLMRENSATLKLTPAGRRYMGFLAIFNSGDMDRLRAFIVDSFTEQALQGATLDAVIAWHQQLYNATDGMRIHKVFLSEEHFVIVITEARRNGKLYMDKMKVSPDFPHKVIEFLHEIPKG
jgi:hypothetical protein